MVNYKTFNYTKVYIYLKFLNISYLQQIDELKSQKLVIFLEKLFIISFSINTLNSLNIIYNS